MYQINISTIATQDIEDHYLYIKEHSPIEAKRWYFKIFAQIQNLKDQLDHKGV